MAEEVSFYTATTVEFGDVLYIPAKVDVINRAGDKWAFRVLCSINLIEQLTPDKVGTYRGR